MQIGSQPKRKKKEIEENWEKIYWSTTCARAYTHAHYHRHAHTQSSTHSHAHAHTQTHFPSLSLVHTRGKEEGDSKKYYWEKSEKCQQSQISIFMTPGPSTRLSLFFRIWKKVGGEFFFLKTEASFLARMLLPYKPPGVEHHPSLYQYDFNSNIRWPSSLKLSTWNIYCQMFQQLWIIQDTETDTNFRFWIQYWSTKYRKF